MKKRHNCRILIVLAVLAVFAIPVGVFASETGSDLRADNIEIQGKHIIENKDAMKSGRHTFVLTAEDKSYPMPEGSENGVKKVTISSNEDFSFGKINIEKAGTYVYTVSREIIGSENLEMDDTKYKVKIATFSDGSAVMVFEKVGSQGKPEEIGYTDKYVDVPEETKEPTTESPETSTTVEPTTEDDSTDYTEETEPRENHSRGKTDRIIDKVVKTGDSMNILLLILAILISGGILLVIVLKNRKKERKN